MALTPDPANLSRKQALYMAKIAEQAERYEDMVKYMKRIVTMGTKGEDLSVEERNLISVGYKNMMSVRRTAWRTIQGMEGHDPDLDSLTEAYKQSVTEEVFALIEEVGEEIVKPYVEGPMAATTTEVLVFFHKMAGDYNRYGAEITKDDIREKYRKEATKSYQGATQSATAGLSTTNPIRLGLALNFSVFHYEICDEKEEATRLAKDAFDQAIDQLDHLADDEYKDSTLIMQLLKDNLTLWNDNAEDEQDIQVEDVA